MEFPNIERLLRTEGRDNRQVYRLRINGLGNNWWVRAQDQTGKDFQAFMTCSTQLSSALFKYEQWLLHADPLPKPKLPADSVLMRALREVGCCIEVNWGQGSHVWKARFTKIADTEHDSDEVVHWAIWWVLMRAFYSAGEILVQQHRLIRG